MKAGDVVHTAPGEKHWHGASPDSSVIHIAISIGGTEWKERVEGKYVFEDVTRYSYAADHGGQTIMSSRIGGRGRCNVEVS
jgi:hypothetical protein